MKANTESLLKHLVNQMKKLDGGKIAVDDANAQANLVKQANNILKYGLERAKILAQNLDQFALSRNKICLFCNEKKSINFFTWNKSYPGNRTPICKKCKSELQAIEIITKKFKKKINKK